MIVVDASAIVDKLAFRNVGDRVDAHLASAEWVWAPDLVYVETASALWRLVRGGELTARHARQALDQLRDLPLIAVPHRALLARAWRFRESVRIADAFYLACAEHVQAPLLTTDGRLARGHHGVPVTLIT